MTAFGDLVGVPGEPCSVEDGDAGDAEGHAPVEHLGVGGAVGMGRDHHEAGGLRDAFFDFVDEGFGDGEHFE